MIALQRLPLRALREPELALWGLFVVLVPFYVFKSGKPQPADFVALLALVVLAVRSSVSIPPALQPVVRALGLFTGYAVIVNLTWSIVLPQEITVQSKIWTAAFPLIYIFNFTIAVAAVARGEITACPRD